MPPSSINKNSIKCYLHAELVRLPQPMISLKPRMPLCPAEQQSYHKKIRVTKRENKSLSSIEI
jgi:hypothetical protein